MTKPFLEIKSKIMEMLLSVPQTPIATNFGYNKDKTTLEYDEIPMITILSISTGPGDYEFDIIQEIKKKSDNKVCLIIIDPGMNIEDYIQFHTITDELYVNPYLDGFSMLLSESLHIPKIVFTRFYNLIQQNITHPNFVFGSNLAWGGIRHIYPNDFSRPLLLNYRSQDFQETLSGFRPTSRIDKYGSTIWQKKNTNNGIVYPIPQSTLSYVLRNRKIWRYYQSIQNAEFIPTMIISKISMKKNISIFAQGIPHNGNIIRIESFQDLLNFFKNCS